MARADAHAARPGEQRLHHARHLQRGHHHARHDDGLPRRRADPRRLRQLPRAADDRRPRHGVPAPERALVLALPLRRHRPAAVVLRRRRRRRSPAGRRIRRSRVQTAGNGQDLWILSLHILTISSLAGAINFIVTIHNMRTRGMTWTRMPLFVWAIETYAVLLVARAADALGRPDAAAARPPVRTRTSSSRTRAAARCSTSTSSGSSGTPRSTS